MFLPKLSCEFCVFEGSGFCDIFDFTDTISVLFLMSCLFCVVKICVYDRNDIYIYVVCYGMFGRDSIEIKSYYVSINIFKGRPFRSCFQTR